MKEEKVNLGQTPPVVGMRDAVHVAVVAMVSDEVLYPSQSVGVLSDGKVSAFVEPIGIVDPFMRKFSFPNEPVWVCLFPNTITSLRHVWTHPQFQAKPPVEIKHE